MKIKKWIILFFTLLIILSFSLIGIGIYFSHLATPQYIMSQAIDKVSTNIEDFWHDYDNYRIGNNFTSESTIQFNLDSEQLAKDSLTSPEALKSYQFLKNLNQLQSHITIMKDSTNNKAFVSIQEKLGNEELLNAKYMIENSTKYYYVNQVLNNYVNDGNCNYFENLNTDNTSADNIEYLYQFIKKSVKENLKKEYFTSYNTEHKIADKNHSIHCISLKLTNKNLKQILKDTLQDLKQDEKANKILTGINNDFSKAKLNDKKNILDTKESYSINIYTSTITYKPLKYEIIHLNKDEKESLFYEKNKNQGDLYFIRDNKVKYHLLVNNNSNLLIKIFDSKESEIGSFQYAKSDSLISIDFDLNNSNDNKYQLNLTSKFQEFKKGNSYSNTTEISFKHLNKKTSVLSGKIVVLTNIQKKVKIKEETSNAILSSTLTPEQQQKYKNLVNTIIERMERQ